MQKVLQVWKTDGCSVRAHQTDLVQFNLDLHLGSRSAWMRQEFPAPTSYRTCNSTEMGGHLYPSWYVAQCTQVVRSERLPGVDLVNSTTSYAYDHRTQTYLQPSFSFQTLQRMLTVNKKAFENISLLEDLVLEKQVIPSGTNLAKTISFAIQERSKSGSVTSSPAILEGVMRALDSQTT